MPAPLARLLAVLAIGSVVATGIVTAATPAHAVSTERLAGANRFDTSVEVSRAAAPYATGGTVFLANGLKFPDALAAGPVVAAEGGHLLLTTPGSLPDSVAERIRELAPSEVVVVGSDASVSDAVMRAAAGITGATVTRIGGTDRVATSLQLLDRLRESGPVESIWVASGFSFPDALVAASVAGRDRSAIILDHHGASEAATQAWLERVAPYVDGVRVRIAGGEPSVSARDARGIAAAGAIEVERYAGPNRYRTAATINDAFATEAGDGAMLLATGQNFPDALSGAVLSAQSGMPMFLSPKACHRDITPMLQDEASERGVQRVVGLGTASSLSDLALRLGPCPVSLPEQIGDEFGRFSMLGYSGSGDRVIALPRGIPYARITAQFAADDYNAIEALDAARELVDLPLAYWGTYRGTTLMATWDASNPVRYLEVQSDGPWIVELRDLTGAPVLSSTARGTGDEVYIYGGPARTVAATYSGSDVFEVREVRTDYPDSPFSHYGSPYSGSASLRSGPSALGVMSDAPWSLTLR